MQQAKRKEITTDEPEFGRIEMPPLKHSRRLQFRAAISNALHRFPIQLARLNDAGGLEQIDVDAVNLERGSAVIYHGDVLQQKTL